MIAAYREPDRTRGRELMAKIIASVGALGFRNLTDYIALLETGGFRPVPHPGL
jgi:hypothetical protein